MRPDATTAATTPPCDPARWPGEVDRAQSAHVAEPDGRGWIDFGAGGALLPYGANEPRLSRRLIRHLLRGGALGSPEQATRAEAAFRERFERVILRPRGLDHGVHLRGASASEGVEAALRWARRASCRSTVLHFRGSFHGLTLGCLSVAGDGAVRRISGVPLNHALQAPYLGDLGPDADTIAHLDEVLTERSGADLPAAVLVETVQVEGGLRTATYEWLRRLAEACRRRGVLLILDESLTACGRTGWWFSFEPAGIHPDLVCLGTALSGMGLPLGVVLARPELSACDPGEPLRQRTVSELSLVAAHEALGLWEDDRLLRTARARGAALREALDRFVLDLPGLRLSVRGRGLLQGLAFADARLAQRAARLAYLGGLLVSTCGPEGAVLRLTPPLTIEAETFGEGLSRLESALTLCADLAEREQPPEPADEAQDAASLSG